MYQLLIAKMIIIRQKQFNERRVAFGSQFLGAVHQDRKAMHPESAAHTASQLGGRERGTLLLSSHSAFIQDHTQAHGNVHPTWRVNPPIATDLTWKTCSEMPKDLFPW